MISKKEFDRKNKPNFEKTLEQKVMDKIADHKVSLKKGCPYATLKLETDNKDILQYCNVNSCPYSEMEGYTISFGKGRSCRLSDYLERVI